MLFSSPLFLFLFLPAALFSTLCARGRWRDRLLLAWSILFYFWGEPRFVPCVLASALADTLIGARIYAAAGSRAGRRWLALGVSLNLLVLVYFKYLNFFADSVAPLLAPLGVAPFGLMHIALPIGVSFIVFEKISYLADLYRRRAEPAPAFADYLLYVFLFPKLLAGPIIKYHDLAPQLRDHRVRIDDLFEGFARFLRGLAKKVLIADTVGRVADQVFDLPPGQAGFGTAWLGVACFTVQIYFDFSGYSDMAIGLARMFGFRLMENFNLPYIAVSFTDFWRRWHISLSTWIREYLYLPLGGNRGGFARTCVNLWICFLLSGLWHGARWTFILWGIYHGTFLILDKLFWHDFSRRLPRWFNIALTLFLVMIGWVMFRAASPAQAWALLAALFDPARDGARLYVAPDAWVALAIGALFSLAPGLLPQDWREWPRQSMALRIAGAWSLSAVALFALGKAVTMNFQPFLYFRF